MSSNKTPNYNLHSWLPADEFHVSEVNENFAGVDTELAVLDRLLKAETAARTQALNTKADAASVTALGRLVTGTYVGTGSGSQTFELGGQVLAVLIECSNGTRPDNNSSATQGGLILPGFQLRDGAAHIDGTSFTISCGGLNGWWYVNRKDEVYYYMAWVR